MSDLCKKWFNHLGRRILYVGNQAGDLDTIVSALASATLTKDFFLSSLLLNNENEMKSTSYQRWKSSSSTATATASIAGKAMHKDEGDSSYFSHLSLVPFPRDNFKFRGDARLLFKTAGIECDKELAPTHIAFLDDFQKELKDYVDTLQQQKQKLVENEIYLVITDHNQMNSDLHSIIQLLPYKVVAIIDHHQDMKAHLDSVPGNLRKIDTSYGSACTMVAEIEDSLQQQHQKDGDGKHSGDSFLYSRKQLEFLLYSTILLDTQNFNPKLLRYNDVDKAMVAKLESNAREFLDKVLGSVSSEELRSKWFTALMSARFDTSGLSVKDLFYIDYKDGTWTLLSDSGPNAKKYRFGLSVILDSFPNFIKRAESAEALRDIGRKFANEKSLDILVAVTGTDERNKRGIIFFSPHEEGEKMIQFLEESLENYHKELLPKELAELPVFAAQGIVEKGFGFGKPLPNLRPVWGNEINGEVSRKTLMPGILHLLSLWKSNL